jgi:hypothetical protein
MGARSTGCMAGWKLKAALLFLWPAVGLAWLAWIATRAALARNATGTFALVSVAGFSVGGGAPAYVETSAPIVRAVVLAPFTGPAVAWGLAHGGEIHCQGSMIVITGMSGGHGPRSAVTVGQVILTSRVALDDPLLAHETVHGDQWAFLGVLTPPLYYLSDVIAGGSEHNIFEVAAGLEDGGYEL